MKNYLLNILYNSIVWFHINAVKAIKFILPGKSTARTVAPKDTRQEDATKARDEAAEALKAEARDIVARYRAGTLPTKDEVKAVNDAGLNPKPKLLDATVTNLTTGEVIDTFKITEEQAREWVKPRATKIVEVDGIPTIVPARKRKPKNGGAK